MMALRIQKTVFHGEAGDIDCVLDLPDGDAAGWALVLHPHPLHGGARENKVVTTIARSCVQRQLLAVRPDFRGVGASAGSFDQGRGETADMRLLVEQFLQARPQLSGRPWVLAGFSFGSAVAAQLYAELQSAGLPLPARLVLVGCAVQRFQQGALELPADTLIVHGEHDEVVPLHEAMDFAREQGLPVLVLPDASHFFHGRLPALKTIVLGSLQGLQSDAA